MARPAPDALNEGAAPVNAKRAAVVAAPAYLKPRVAQGQELPRVEVGYTGMFVETACVRYALELDGGRGGVALDGALPHVGMLKEVLVELCEMIVPEWALDKMQFCFRVDTWVLKECKAKDGV